MRVRISRNEARRLTYSKRRGSQYINYLYCICQPDDRRWSLAKCLNCGGRVPPEDH